MKFRKLYESIEPSEKQKIAGNYKKRKVSWNGLTITIENDAGSYRSGIDSDGKKWKTKIYYDYGYINGTEAKDGDQIDVFLGPNKKSEIIFIINQIKQKSGIFDEYKVMLNFDTKEEASKAYLKNYKSGWKLGEIIGMSLDRFKEWIKKGNHNKPAEIS